MDVREALITELYAVLTTDPALGALFILPDEVAGMVRMQEDLAQPNTSFPYLTHRLDLMVPDSSWALLDGTWYLDIWDHGPNRDRLYDIRARIITLLGQTIFTPAGGEIVAAQVSLRYDRSGPTDAADVHRIMLEWELHLDRQGEVAAILA